MKSFYGDTSPADVSRGNLCRFWNPAERHMWSQSRKKYRSMWNDLRDMEKANQHIQVFLFNNAERKHRLEDSEGAFMTFVSIITNHVSEIMSSEGKATK